MKPDQPYVRPANDQLVDRVNAQPGEPGGVVQADGHRAMTDRLRVERYRLANGLKVVVMEDDAAPAFAFQIWYGVGSKHERVGKTGLAHFFEHLLFRESEGLAEGEFDRIIEMNGGANNASTWVDWTYYRESLPVGAPSAPAGWTPPPVLRPLPQDRLELVVRLEAERMGNMKLSEQQVDAERGAVKSERLYRVDNDPEGKMYEVLYDAAFTEHPYRWPTIGWMADIEAYSRADVVDFYDTWYSPNNATVVVVGAVRTERVLSLMRRWFGPLPAKDLPAFSGKIEPPQDGERRRQLEMPLTSAKVLLGYHVPGQLHPDHAALEVANEVLFGGRSSRLHRRLVTGEELASDVAGWVSPFADPGVMEVMITAKRGTRPAQVEGALYAEVAKLADDGPSSAEVDKARARLEAELLREIASLGGRAEALGHFEATGGDFGHLMDQVSRWNAVGEDDVKRVVGSYLADRNRTVVIARPKVETPEAGEEADDEAGDGPATEPAGGGGASSGVSGDAPLNHRAEKGAGGGGPDGATRPRRPVHRADLDNGVHGILVEDHSFAMVRLSVTLKVGAVADPPGKEGLGMLTSQMLLRGAGGRSRAEVEETVDSLGASLDAGAAHTSMALDGETLTRNLDAFAELLHDALVDPTFDVSELERLKRETVSEIESLRDDDQGLASRFFRTEVYAGHPYGRPPIGTIRSVRGIGVEDVRAFFKQHFVGRNMVVSAAGDLDGAAFVTLLRDRFAEVPAGEAEVFEVGPAPRPPGRRVVLVDKPERTQAQILIGHDGIAAEHPDRPALTVLNTAFGGTFTARLMQEIRVDQGWSYGAYSRIGADRDAGSLHMWIFPEIEHARAATERTIELFEAVARTGLTDAELAFAKDYVVGGFAFVHETPGRLVDELVRMEILGLPRDHLDTWVDRISSVTLADVKRVATERLHPDHLVITVLATASDLEAELKAMPGVGEVRVLPYDSD